MVHFLPLASPRFPSPKDLLFRILTLNLMSRPAPLCLPPSLAVSWIILFLTCRVPPLSPLTLSDSHRQRFLERPRSVRLSRTLTYRDYASSFAALPPSNPGCFFCRFQPFPRPSNPLDCYDCWFRAPSSFSRLAPNRL